MVIVGVLLVAVLADRARAAFALHHRHLHRPEAAVLAGGRLAGLSPRHRPIGRDILSRLIYGARLSLLIGIAVVAISIVVGIVLGLVAGFFRGLTEIVIMRLMDIILTLPSLLLAIVIVAILGPGLMNAMLAVAIVVLPHYVRLARAAVITETSKDYVTAARVAGAGTLRLMFKEVLPNCTAPLIVQAIARHLDRDPRRRGARLPRPRRAAADAGMGHHAGRRARIRAARLVGRDLPGPRDPRSPCSPSTCWATGCATPSIRS